LVDVRHVLGVVLLFARVCDRGNVVIWLWICVAVVASLLASALVGLFIGGVMRLGSSANELADDAAIRRELAEMTRSGDDAR
jgi:hypothetical protein